MKRGFAVSAEMTRLPSLRATSLSGGNCSFLFTSADCAPAVERPSSQSLASMMRRNSATSSLLSTLGTQTSILRPSEPCRDLHRGGAAGRLQHERRRALIQAEVIELVEDVVDEESRRPVLVDLRLGKGIEAPEARNGCALVCSKQSAAGDRGAIDGLTSELPGIVELIFAQQAERLRRDVGKRQADVRGIQDRIG